MKLLNIGCGETFHPAWVNIDILPKSPEVLRWDVRHGLTFDRNMFDAVYSSHVIEHLTTAEAAMLLAEAFRVLKPGGIVRIVVPDLEGIVRLYLEYLEKGMGDDPEAGERYDWMMLELYDQSVRTCSGGEMGKYLGTCGERARGFIFDRIGREANMYWDTARSGWRGMRHGLASKIWRRGRILLAEIAVLLIAGRRARMAFKEGMFRCSGEVHRWMYDRYSLGRMLRKAGFVDIALCRPSTSKITDFASYGLDVFEGQVRKPDSLYMEARKP